MSILKKSKYQFVSFLTFVLLFQSCSLLKINMDLGVKPLPKKDLNARLNVRLYTADFINVTSVTADTIFNRVSKMKNYAEYFNLKDSLAIRCLVWKKNVSSAAINASLTAVPNGALLNMLVVTKGVDKFINHKNTGSTNNLLVDYFGNQTHIAQKATKGLVNKYEELIQDFLSTDEYKLMSNFADSVLNASPFDENFTYKDYSYDYIKYSKISNTSYLQTVGSISEVISDLNDKLSAYTQNYTNQINWGTDILQYKIKTGFSDSAYKQKLDSLNLALRDLNLAVRNTPNKADSLMKVVDNRLTALLSEISYNVNNTLNNTFYLLDIQRDSLQNYISAERKVAFEQGKKVIDDSMVKIRLELSKLIRNILIYFILFVFVLLGVPFYIGYRIGHNKKKVERNT